MAAQVKKIEDYTREDLFRLAQVYSGNIVGGFLIEQGIIEPADLTSNGYIARPENILLAKNAEQMLLDYAQKKFR